MPNEKTLETFFKYFVIGFIFCLFRVDLTKNYVDVLVDLFVTFFYCMIVGVWGGLGAMFGHIISVIIRKKLKK